MKILFFLFLTFTAHAAESLTHLEGCTLVKTNWSDGGTLLRLEPFLVFE